MGVYNVPSIWVSAFLVPALCIRVWPVAKCPFCSFWWILLCCCLIYAMFNSVRWDPVEEYCDLEIYVCRTWKTQWVTETEIHKRKEVCYSGVPKDQRRRQEVIIMYDSGREVSSELGVSSDGNMSLSMLQRVFCLLSCGDWRVPGSKQLKQGACFLA